MPPGKSYRHEGNVLTLRIIRRNVKRNTIVYRAAIRQLACNYERVVQASEHGPDNFFRETTFLEKRVKWQNWEEKGLDRR